MKKILLFGGLLSLVFLQASCDAEDLTITNQKQLRTASSTNSENPYDEIGMLYYNLLDIYLTSANTANSIENCAIELNRLLAASYLGQATIPINTDFTILINQIITDPEKELYIFISEMGLSLTVAAKINDLIGLVVSYTNNPYAETLTAINSFENEVLSHATLDFQEKEILLSVTSIFKVSIDDNRNKDKDWDLSVGNIVAITYGAIHSQQDAILMGLTTQLYQKQI